jgi:acetyl esterase/lipase
MSHGIITAGRRLLPALAAWLLAACGGGGDDAPTTRSSPPAQTSEPSPAMPACPAGLQTGEILPSAVSAPLCDPANFDTHAEVAYAPHARGLLDLMIPRGATAPVPLVVWIHGGGWQSGDKSNRAQATQLLCRGYAVAAVNYRLSDTDTFPAQIHDVKAAIRFLRANAAAYGLDGTRFAAFGSSAGGHLAALAGTSTGIALLEDLSLGNGGASSRVQATVDWYGPTLVSEMDAQLLAQGCSAGRAHHGDTDSAESRMLGCTVGDPACAEAVRVADPANYADVSDAPMLLMHGTADCTVPLGQSTWLSERMVAAGACAVQKDVRDAGHGGPSWTSPEAQLAVADFLDLVLR